MGSVGDCSPDDLGIDSESKGLSPIDLHGVVET